jgi:DNA repair protein RecO (recombination protein O)
MTHKTKGIVLRAIKYGETSLVVTIFTELFGIQTYMVNGVRTAKRTGSKAQLYQPATLLQMEVYHNDLKGMQRIKESERSIMYVNLFNNVVRHSISLFMIELLHKTLKQPENNPELFYFCEEAFMSLDQTSESIAANVPLYFSMHLCYFYGFRIDPPVNVSELNYIDLVEGSFTDVQPHHPHFITGEEAVLTADILRVMQINELHQIKLNSMRRRKLLHKYIEYYALHIQDFGTMRTLPVLEEVLG